MSTPEQGYELEVYIAEMGLIGDVTIKPPLTIDTTMLIDMAGMHGLEFQAVVNDEERTMIQLRADEFARNAILGGRDITEIMEDSYHSFASGISRIARRAINEVQVN